MGPDPKRGSRDRQPKSAIVVSYSLWRLELFVLVSLSSFPFPSAPSPFLSALLDLQPFAQPSLAAPSLSLSSHIPANEI